jgi:hypothetical protein
MMVENLFLHPYNALLSGLDERVPARLDRVSIRVGLPLCASDG